MRFLEDASQKRYHLIATIPESVLSQINSPLQPVSLLASRDAYTTCHVQVPDVPDRLPAITFGGGFFSFFRSLGDPVKALGHLLKLSGRGDRVAVTFHPKGYGLWIYEPDGVLAKASPRLQERVVLPALSPPACWVIGGRQPGYRTCSLKVPDLADVVPGLVRDNGHYFSVYRREQDADRTLKVATRLVQRGDEVVLLIGKSKYVVCVHEPGAIAAQ